MTSAASTKNSIIHTTL